MELTKEQEAIVQGKVCPYCKSKTEYIDSSFVYKKSYGMIYICKPCNAYCGVHKGTSNALGRVANKELREWKQKAHNAFDEIWKSQLKKRSTAYNMMSVYLKIPRKYCHIGMFSISTCQKVVEWANKIIGPKDIAYPNILEITSMPQYTEYLLSSENDRMKMFYAYLFPIIKKKSRHLKSEHCYTDMAGKVKFYPKSNKILFCKECRWEEDGLDRFIQHLCF
jgi:hypothetical protein